MFRGSGWLRRWRPWHLVAAAIGYWVVLFAVTLGRAAVLLHDVSGPGAHGNVGVSAQAGHAGMVLGATISDASKHVLWSGSIGVISLALLIAAPPLLLWFSWLAARSRPAPPTTHLVGRAPPDFTRNAAPASDRLSTPVAPADSPPPTRRR